MPDNSTSTTFDCKIVVPASHFLQLDSPVYQNKKKIRTDIRTEIRTEVNHILKG